MTAKAQFKTLLMEFGQILDIEPLALNEDSGCTLSFDDQVINIQFVEEDGSFILFSDLGNVSESNRTQMYQEMLAANFYRNKIKNAAIAYCTPTDSIVLVLQLPVAGLGFRHFEELIQNFIDIAESWTHRIMDENKNHSESTKEPSKDSTKTGWIKI